MLRVAIDGPSGTGKSTIAKATAVRFGLEYIDTGAMYRALGLKARRTGVDEFNEDAVREMLDVTSIDFNGGATMLDGEDVMNGFLVCAACFLHGINFHSHKRFSQGAAACLLISLILQFMTFFMSTSLAATAAVLLINYAAFFLLPKQYANKTAVTHNKTYILLTYLILSVLLFLHPDNVEHLQEKSLRIITHDSLGWGILPQKSYPLPAFMGVSTAISCFLYFGFNLTAHRPSALLALIAVDFFLFTPWNPVTAVLFCIFVCYIPLEKKYVTLDDLTEMEEVPAALEWKVLKEFARTVKKIDDLDPLQRYIYRHPTLISWHLYLQLSQRYVSPELYKDIISVAKIFLDLEDEDEIPPHPEPS